jgi:basic amino acid/polyamine antiporter, APA family
MKDTHMQAQSPAIHRLMKIARPDTFTAAIAAEIPVADRHTDPIILKNPVAQVPTVSVVTATALVVANMVGVGVFTSLGFQVADIPRGFPIMLLWIIGGVAALCGALSYAELAAALPRSGGEYNFLSRIYHPAAGFLAGWISATIGFSAPTALLAMAFGEYFSGAFPGLHVSPVQMSLALLWLVSLAHLRGLRQGSLFQNAWTYVNIGLIVALVVAGFASGKAEPISFAPRAGDWNVIRSAPFAVSLVWVMYSYSGWNASTYIVNEIREPQRNVPRSVFLGTLLVVSLYVGLNAMFLRTTPIEKLAGKVQVALAAASHVFGPEGGRIVGALICVGLVACISSMTWIGPRVTMVMGEDLAALRFFSKKTAAGVPAPAILLQLAIATVLLLTSSFRSVANYTMFSLTACSFLTVLGVIVLRWRQPNLPRPYRTWGYPVTPLIFLVVSAWMMIFMLREKRTESLAGVGTMVAGLAVYFLSPKQRQEQGVTPQLTPEK